jgi:hypothetical protein
VTIRGPALMGPTINGLPRTFHFHCSVEQEMDRDPGDNAIKPSGGGSRSSTSPDRPAGCRSDKFRGACQRETSAHR